MVLGALGFSAFQRHPFRDALSLARTAYFTAGLRRAIAPIEETRRAVITAVLRRIDERMRANRTARNRERKPSIPGVGQGGSKTPYLKGQSHVLNKLISVPSEPSLFYILTNPLARSRHFHVKSSALRNSSPLT